ncbi:MAG TPA: PilZ domain-containing protein [Candidatus Nitrosotenuis sp.]|nr:PilZ domain-containing protein [Candidatus Nitrosotenuis sp.]
MASRFFRKDQGGASPADKRRRPRFLAQLPGHLLVGEGQRLRCIVVEASEEGLRLACLEPVAGELWVDLSFNGLRLCKRVRVLWRQELPGGWVMGVQFAPSAQPDNLLAGFVRWLNWRSLQKMAG